MISKLICSNYKPLVLIVILQIIFISINKAQDCKIVPMFRFSSSYYDGLGLIGDEYRKIRDSTNDGIQIMLIDRTSFSKNIWAFCIYINNQKELHFLMLNQDSIFYNSLLSNSANDLNSIFSDDLPNQYFFSSCSSSESFHRSVYLIIYNHFTNKFAEYECSDGNIEDALKQNDDFDYLKTSYYFITKVYKHLNLYKQ